jgi:hypothetical protein
LLLNPFSGYPMSITGGNVTFQSQGVTNNQVYVGFYSGGTGSSALTFGNSGTVNLDASAAANGAGGMLTVSAYTPTSFTMNANGPSSGNGAGGSIIYSTNGSSTFSPTMTELVTANGSGTGNAVISPFTSGDPEAIEFFPGATNLTIGTAPGQFSFFAKGGGSGGNGGGININPNPGNITVTNVLAVDASAPGTTGTGGNIQLLGTATPYVTLTYNANPIVALKATGGTTSGQGGTVSVNTAISSDSSQFIDANAIIQVDGGSMLGTSDFDGSISLNNVTCQQNVTSNSPTWPASYWDCSAKYGNYLSPSSVVASNLSSTLRMKTGTSRIKLYVFHYIADYQNFFKSTPPTEAGETWVAVGTTPNIYSSVWLVNPASSNPFSDTTLREVTIHETGHAFDNLLGQTNQSGNDTYNTFVQNDFLKLDYANVVVSSQAASTPRLPCALTPIPGTMPVQYYAGNVPFANVVDANGNSVCTGAVLSTTYSGYTTNSSIIQAVNVGQYWFTQHNLLWNELYAQNLAYTAYAHANAITLFAYVVPDNVFKNGYYVCAGKWASAIQAGGTTPPNNAACKAAIPTWYVF